ncbi:hypothetical protein ACHQM5_027044 [Ranunculus cassubicifolius]
MNANQLPVSKFPNEASSSGKSKDDHEMGAYSSSHSGDSGEEDGTICCFGLGKDFQNSCRMFFAEMLGTFILMFCVCGIVASTQLLRGEVGLLEYAATGGLTIVVLIFSIGPISGAHVNPSVTLAFAFLGHTPWSKVPFYMLSQVLGSLLATYVGSSIYGIDAELVTTRPLNGVKTAFWAEFIATFIIMFLAASMSFEPLAIGHLAGFVVGIAISLTILVTGPVSGGSLNPARSLGPAVISWKFDYIWVYLVAPTVGAVVGAYVARILRIQRRTCTSSVPNSLIVQ